MRILFCNKYNFPFSGTEVYLFELMELLRSHGHEVALFSMADPRGKATRFDQHFVPLTDFKNSSKAWLTRVQQAGHAIYSTDARVRLKRLLAEFLPDIAHVRNIYHHLTPSILWELKEQRIPVLYHLNDFKLLCPAYNLVTNGRACERPCTGKFWRAVTDGCFTGPPGAGTVLVAEAYFHHWLGSYRKCVDHYLTPSRFAKELLVKNGFDQQNISVLPHFQEMPPIPHMAKQNAPILYFGRLSPEKGVADLLHAMSHLPHLRLQIAGEGPQRSELEHLSESFRLNNVEFVGHLSGENLDRAIAASRFTVLPSHAYETLGKSILESYAWARAVVASDLGSRRELVQDGKTGVLYEVGNVDQLAKTISTLADNPQLTAQMGLAGRRFVETNHTSEKHYRELLQLYERMLARVSARSENKTATRVAFIGGRGVVSKYSGIEAYYEEVGPGLARLGYEVTAYCRNHFTPNLQAHKSMRLVRLPTIRSKHFETVVHTFLSTLHVMFSSNEIVHYHALGPALFSFLPRLAGKKTIVTVQGLDWQRKKWGRIAARVLRMGEIASARFPDSTMVVSKTLREHYRDRHNAETIYIPNGTIMRARTISDRLGEWGLEPDHYALFLGRFSPEKNCHLLIEAFKRLKTNSKLVLAGGSSHTDEYAASLRRHANERIVFLDWVSGEALNDLLTNAALFVLPSDLEGLSLALLDAMGAGVCVLTSDIPENRELVDGGAGFTFRVGDVNDLARMMGSLLSDSQLRAVAAQNARRVVRERYLWPDIAKQIAEVYERTLEGRPVKPAISAVALPTSVPVEQQPQQVV